MYQFLIIAYLFTLVYIMRDLNAQTGNLEDYTSSDAFLSDVFNFDDSIIDFDDQRCALKRLGSEK